MSTGKSINTKACDSSQQEAVGKVDLMKFECRQLNTLWGYKQQLIYQTL